MAARKHISIRLFGCLFTFQAENLTNISGIAVTPFSMEDIQKFIDFINLSKSLDTGNDKPINVARSIIITNIIANFCASNVLVLFFKPYNNLTMLQILIDWMTISYSLKDRSPGASKHLCGRRRSL